MWWEAGGNCIIKSFISCIRFLNSIKVIKERIMGWAGYVACMGEMRNTYKILIGKPEGKNYLQELDIDGRVMDLRETGWRKVWNKFVWLMTGSSGWLLWKQ
jgi:hypothetical protein